MVKLLRYIHNIRIIFEAVFGGVLDFVDRRFLVRRAILMIVLWMTVDVYLFAKGLAALPGRNGAELGVVIASLTVPCSMLMGYLYKSYDDVRAPVQNVTVDTQVTTKKA